MFPVWFRCFPRVQPSKVCPVRVLVLLLLLVGCTRSMTFEVEGTAREGTRVNFGPRIIGTVDSVAPMNPDGLSAVTVKVDRDFVLPDHACAYVVGDEVNVRVGETDSAREDWIPHCPHGDISVEGVMEGFFQELGESSFDQQVRQAIQPAASRIELPLPKPEDEEGEPTTATETETD